MINHNSSWHGYRAGYVVFWITVALMVAVLVVAVVAS
jgi:hypothetical protein